MNLTPPALQALLVAFIHPRAAPAPAARPAPREPQSDEGHWGCGWFDSSHDLQQGLQLNELASPDELAAELPLAFWLQIDLAGRCSAASA